MNKRGRKELPDHMKAVTTSLRLRPDRLVVFKQLGGTKWLNAMLDEEMYFNVMFEDIADEMGTGGQVSP
jgi:predicted protein tyrosine phosphatase